MSTLPRLPAKYRGFANGTGFPQLGSKTHFQPPRQANSALSPTTSSVTHTRQPTSVNYQLQGIRDIALKKYEAYNSQLRQMERNFQLEIKRSDQQTTRNLSKIVDLISSLQSEMSQLNNQSNLLKNKIDVLKNKQIETQTTGVETMLSPLKNGFDAFGREFECALKNINTLFSNLASRVKHVQQDFNSTKSINSEVTEINELIKNLQKSLQNNSTQLVSIQKEFDNTINIQKENVTKKIQDKMSALHSRIENLEQCSFQILNKSQNVISDMQASQYDMRGLFNSSMNITANSFKSKLNDSKRSLFELQQNRFEQIDAVRSRLSNTSDSISKMRKQKLRNVIDDQSSNRHSLKPEIERLTKKVEELESQLDQKLGVNKSDKKNIKAKKNRSDQKKGVKLFYNLDGGDVKVIIVDENGNVI